MRCELKIVSGGRAGHREVFDKPYLTLGRDPQSDLPLDPNQDLDASTRHAAVVRTGDRFVVRDLGSRNGTFVNGHRITGDTELKGGDRLRFGPQGPEVEFHAVADGAEQVVPAVRAPAPAPKATAAPSARPPAARTPPAPSATSVLRAQVNQQAARYRWALVVLAFVVVAAVVVVLWQGWTAQRQFASIGTVVDSLSREVRMLRVAQARADSEATTLRGQLASERDPTRLASLQQEYAAVQRRQRSITVAQSVNWAAINRANARAVAMIYVQFPDDSTFTGTGFSVSANGLLLTNKHVVMDRAGRTPIKIGVQFAGSRAVLRAVLERVAPDVDIATVQITDSGTYPVVRGLKPDSAAPSVGDPIALLGFPLGLDAPMGGTAEHPIVQPTLAPGTIAKILTDSLLQLDAYSGTGASGSPVLDREGLVIGIEYGGLRDSGGRVVLGLPIRRATPLLTSSTTRE
jgi:S1-C subfamily serine protease